MALSKQLPDDICVTDVTEKADNGEGEEPFAVPWWGWADEWSTQAVHNLGAQWQASCRQLQKSVERIDVTAPLAELGGDLVNFSAALGRRISLPLAELSGDLVNEVHLRTARTIGRLEEQYDLILSYKSFDGDQSSICKPSSLDCLVGPDLAQMMEDRYLCGFIISGLLTRTPSGMLVMASVNPPLSLKAACIFVGVSMIFKCYVIAARDTTGVPEDCQPRKDVGMAVTGICGAVNLAVAFGGLPAMLKLGGLSIPHFSGYVAHPDLCLHYLADIVINPMLLYGIAQSATNQRPAAVTVMPAMVASAIGAGCMAGSSLAMSPLFCSLCAGANVCCILFQNWDLQSSYPNKARTRQVADAYIFAQSVYMVPTILAITGSYRAAVVAIPLIDMLGKMGVVQLTHNAAAEQCAPAPQLPPAAAPKATTPLSPQPQAPPVPKGAPSRG